MKKVQYLHRLSLRQKIEVVQHVLEHFGNFRSHLQKHSQKPIYWTVILNKRDTRPITTINPNLGHHEISPRPPTDTTINLAFWQGWFDKENFFIGIDWTLPAFHGNQRLTQRWKALQERDVKEAQDADDPSESQLAEVGRPQSGHRRQHDGRWKGPHNADRSAIDSRHADPAQYSRHTPNVCRRSLEVLPHGTAPSVPDEIDGFGWLGRRRGWLNPRRSTVEEGTQHPLLLRRSNDWSTISSINLVFKSNVERPANHRRPSEGPRSRGPPQQPPRPHAHTSKSRLWVYARRADAHLANEHVTTDLVCVRHSFRGEPRADGLIGDRQSQPSPDRREGREGGRGNPRVSKFRRRIQSPIDSHLFFITNSLMVMRGSYSYSPKFPKWWMFYTVGVGLIGWH